MQNLFHAGQKNHLTSCQFSIHWISSLKGRHPTGRQEECEKAAFQDLYKLKQAVFKLAQRESPITVPLELDLRRQPTDWRRWNKTRFRLDDERGDGEHADAEHVHDEHADDGADEDEADADDDGEDHLSLHLSE